MADKKKDDYLIRLSKAIKRNGGEYDLGEYFEEKISNKVYTFIIISIECSTYNVNRNYVYLYEPVLTDFLTLRSVPKNLSLVDDLKIDEYIKNSKYVSKGIDLDEVRRIRFKLANLERNNKLAVPDVSYYQNMLYYERLLLDV